MSTSQSIKMTPILTIWFSISSDDVNAYLYCMLLGTSITLRQKQTNEISIVPEKSFLESRIGENDVV